MPTATRTAPRRARSPSAFAAYRVYSAGPLASLLFILPLLILHEIGLAYFGGAIEQRITAFALMTRFFDSFGATARYLPAMAVVAVLLAWHMATRQAWKFYLGQVALMGAEALLWALPLVAIFLLIPSGGPVWRPSGDRNLIACLYLGAGVYEEAVFRLAGFAVLSLVFIDLAKINRRVAIPLVISTGAALFAAYHLLGSQSPPWQSLVFIGLRGVYYGIIFLERGFGVTVGVHTIYDIFFLILAPSGPA